MFLEIIIFVVNIFDENWIPYLDDGNLGSTGVLYVEITVFDSVTEIIYRFQFVFIFSSNLKKESRCCCLYERIIRYYISS